MSVSDQGAEIDIRPAVIGDAAVIHSMIAELARDTGKPQLVVGDARSISEHGFGDRPAFEALIAWRGETPVGLALYYPEYSTWRGRRGVYLLDLFVARAERGSGLGRKLIGALAARAKSAGAAYLRLAVDEANEDAAAFYARLGFGEISEDRLFVLEGAEFMAAANE